MRKEVGAGRRRSVEAERGWRLEAEGRRVAREERETGEMRVK